MLILIILNYKHMTKYGIIVFPLFYLPKFQYNETHFLFVFYPLYHITANIIGYSERNLTKIQRNFTSSY